MNFEFNKIAGAVLGTALGVMSLSILSEIIFEPPHHEEPGYVIAVAGGGEGGEGGAPEPVAVEPIEERLQVATVDAGMGQAKKCQACHTFDQGGPAKVGPNLWNVVGSPLMHSPDFDYSDAMAEKAEGGTEWTFANLDEFLTNPKKYIPGTAMAFAGIKRPDQRADVIAYLRTLSDNPVPIPTVTAEAPTDAAMDAPAGDEPAMDGEPAAEDEPSMADPATDEPAMDEEPAMDAAESPAPESPASDSNN